MPISSEKGTINNVVQKKTTKKSMGNSPTDKSKDFIKSGMTLITQIESERLLKKSNQKKTSKNRDK
mgnify:CR=1 FL=1